MQLSMQWTWISLNLSRVYNQARRWVEGKFSSSKYALISQMCKKKPLRADHLLFIAKGYTTSRYKTTQRKSWWPDAPVRMTRRVRLLQDKQQQCALERAIVVTGHATPFDRTRCTRCPIEVQRARAIGCVWSHVTRHTTTSDRSPESSLY
jgi:hypothetical protein